MTAPFAMRRGWCPDMLRPMATADGLLVRIHPRGGSLSAAQATAIADGARIFGNGLLDLSSRGNIQVRGVTAEGHAGLAERLIDAGLLEGVRNESPFRLTTLSPLAGIDREDRIDALTLADLIEAAGQTIDGLHPKISIVVDGGGSFPLDDVLADIRLVALSETRIALALARSSGPEWIGVLAPRDVPAATSTILSALSHDGSAPGLRMRDIDDGGLNKILGALRLGPSQRPAARPAARRVGYANEALFLAPPYGRCTADALAQVAVWSEIHGRGDIRLSPTKSLVIPHVPVAAEGPLTALVREAGFISDNQDPRLAIMSCPGSDGCVRGSTHTHRDADRIAGLLRAGTTVHVSGCAKGCAHPGAADLTLVGEDGAYQVVLGGTARDKPVEQASIDRIVERLADISDGTDLMRIFGTARP